MNKLILGSTSPYKRALLEEAGYVFSIEDNQLDERANHLDTVANTVKHLAELKAQAVLEQHANKEVTVITTDVAGELILDGTGQFLGKPESLNEAFNMIMSYSEQLLYIWCGTVVAKQVVTNGNTRLELISDLRRADIQFAKLDPVVVQQYIDEMNPIDKGGAIAIEEIEDRGFITAINGEREAIIGISMQFVQQQLNTK